MLSGSSAVKTAWRLLHWQTRGRRIWLGSWALEPRPDWSLSPSEGCGHWGKKKNRDNFLPQVQIIFVKYIVTCLANAFLKYYFRGKIKRLRKLQIQEKKWSRKEKKQRSKVKSNLRPNFPGLMYLFSIFTIRRKWAHQNQPFILSFLLGDNGLWVAGD